MFYRLYTEDKNRDKLIGLISESFQGFTIIEALGYWEGKPEKSLIIEIAMANDWSIKELTADICKMNEQTCVLVSKIETENSLIGKDITTVEPKPE